MRNEGLYIRMLPDGKIKRHLITILEEVPLTDTTIAAELIGLSDQNHVAMYQTIKEIWAYTDAVGRSLADLRAFEKRLGSYLHWLRNIDLVRYSLFMTTYEDLEEKPNYHTPQGAMQIANLLTDSMEPDFVVNRALYALSMKTVFDLDGEHDFLKESRCIAHHLFEDSVAVEYQFRK